MAFTGRCLLYTDLTRKCWLLVMTPSVNILKVEGSSPGRFRVIKGATVAYQKAILLL